MEYQQSQILPLLLEAKELFNQVKLYQNKTSAFYPLSETELKLIREIKHWWETNPSLSYQYLEQTNLTQYELAFLIGMLLLHDSFN